MIDKKRKKVGFILVVDFDPQVDGTKTAYAAALNLIAERQRGETDKEDSFGEPGVTPAGTFRLSAMYEPPPPSSRVRGEYLKMF